MSAVVRAGVDTALAASPGRSARAVHEAVRGDHWRHAPRRGGGAVFTRAELDDRGGRRSGGSGADRARASGATRSAAVVSGGGGTGRAGDGGRWDGAAHGAGGAAGAAGLAVR